MSWGYSPKWDRWLAGVALSRNEGMGVYAGSESGTGGDPRLAMRSPAGSEYEDWTHARKARRARKPALAGLHVEDSIQ